VIAKKEAEELKKLQELMDTAHGGRCEYLVQGIDPGKS